MTTNQEKQKILMKSNLTRKDIQALTEFNYLTTQKIFTSIRDKILTKIKKEDPSFEFLDNKYLPTIHALPYLKRYGIDKETIFTNAEIERSSLNE